METHLRAGEKWLFGCYIYKTEILKTKAETVMRQQLTGSLNPTQSTPWKLEEIILVRQKKQMPSPH